MILILGKLGKPTNLLTPSLTPFTGQAFWMGPKTHFLLFY